MKNKLVYCILLIAFVFGNSEAQYSKYDQDFFAVPIKHKIKISGSFAELRPNHFHMGIDFKSSKGVSGDPIFAAAGGFVSRIKVQSGGYGNSIYIDHPNGYTTVYAHLKHFDQELADYVKSRQYEAKSFEIDIYPEPGKFIFKKGDQIGLMGSTGHSFGPHLHFEIRETDSEIPVNPFLFGIKPPDTKKPDLRKIRIYKMNSDVSAEKSYDYALVPKADGSKGIKGDTISIPAWRIGIGIEAYDYMNGATNRNGLYNLEMRIDEQLVYSFTMDKVSFDETRYLNAHIDYKERQLSKRYFQKCYVQKGNRLSIYDEGDSLAIIPLFAGKAQKVNIKGTDVEGNQTEVEFYIKRNPEINQKETEVYNYLLKHDEPNVINEEGVALHFPENCIYEDLQFYMSSASSGTKKIKSPIFHLHNDKVPVHKAYEVHIKIPEIADSLHSKLCLVSISNKSYLSYGGQISDSLLIAKVHHFGSFGLMVDDVPPTITPIRYRRDVRGRSYMSFKIHDNLSTTGIANGLEYNAWIDGEWILMEYDKKNKLLKHYFEKSLGPGKHHLKLEVIDDRNNKKEFISEFIR